MSERKRQKRIAEVTELIQNDIIAKNEINSVAAKGNDDLFVLDTTGSKSAKKRVLKSQDDAIKPNSRVSKTEQRLVQKVLSKKEISVSRGAKSTSIAQNSTQLVKSNVEDLWGDTISSSLVNKRNKKLPVDKSIRSVRTKAPIAGQSYNPSVKGHQEALTLASTLEQEKRKKDEREKGAMDTTVSEFTKSLIKADSDSESDSDDESEDGTVELKLIRDKQKEKMTKAQRNKQRRHKETLHQHVVEKASKRLLADLDSLPSVLKSIRREEAKTKAKSKKKSNIVVEEPVLTYLGAGTIPLSDELHGSIRQLMPKKNCLLAEEIEKLQANKEITVQGRRRRRGGEKNPYGPKKVKWIPKHKYV